jgi:ribosome-associated toxin RatA of RatAB toxin-antitoxin module
LKEISVKKEIPAEIHRLFDFTQDIEKRLLWDKQTEEIRFIRPHIRLKEGAEVYVLSKGGVELETRYLSFDRPNEISIEMTNQAGVFKTFYGRWDYSSTEKDQTILKITYRFKLKFPYNLLYNTASRKINRNIRMKLKGLYDYIVENPI